VTRFPVPEESRLAQLIKEAHDFLPGPDMARLEQIEGRLAGQLKPGKRAGGPNRLPWWIVLLLVSGFAAAAWWTGVQWLGGEPAPSGAPRQSLEKQSETAKPAPDKARELHDEAGEAEEEESSPVIYQRESF
jgi:hypothetical protein